MKNEEYATIVVEQICGNCIYSSRPQECAEGCAIWDRLQNPPEEKEEDDEMD